MRLIRFLIALACLVAGAAVGALNREAVVMDFGVLLVTTSVGVALIVSLLSGVLLGGLAVSAGVVLPLRRRLADTERRQRSLPATVDP